MARHQAGNLHSRRLVLFIAVALALGVLGYNFSRSFGERSLSSGSEPDSADPSSHLASGSDASDLDAELLEQMEAMGYLAGSMPAPAVSGITVYDANRAHNGFNLILSGHDYVASLFDMEGNTLHTWRLDSELAFPEHRTRRPQHRTMRPRFFERAHVFRNGELLVIVGGQAIGKLDKDSTLLWILRDSFHHDFDIGDDGTIYALFRAPGRIVVDGTEQHVAEDFVCLLDERGEVMRKISISQALANSRFAYILEKGANNSDHTHTNSVQYLDGSLAHLSPLYANGRVLVSCRTLDAIAIIDLETELAVWAMAGPWGGQHSASVLDSGRMLVFDNRGLGDRSRVMEFDPASGDPFWIYGEAESETFFTSSVGFCERLANGNTLIVESNPGRVFEVTNDKEVVWDFTNPFRVTENRDVIATLFGVVRLPQDFPLEWTQRAADDAMAE